jgi:integrase
VSIQQTKAGTWSVDHYYFDSEGKRRRKLRTFAKHKDAVAYQKETLAAVAKNEFVAPTKETVGERATIWFEKRFASGAYERATRIERENYVKNYIVPAFGALPIQNLGVERIEKQAAEWNKEVAAMVVNRVLRTLTDIMSEAKRYGIIKDNPAAEAVRLKEATLEQEVFTADELRRVIESTESGSMERVIIMTLALTGARVGELLGASWDAMDLKAGRFFIRTSLADPDKGQEMIFKKPKSRSSERSVPLSRELIRELRLWRMKCPPSPRGLVIISDQGKPVRRRAVWELLHKILQDLGINRKLSPHNFRHSFASMLLAKKRPVPEVTKLLGHANSAITYRTYAHHVPGEEIGSVQELSASILDVSNVSKDVSIASGDDR